MTRRVLVVGIVCLVMVLGVAGVALWRGDAAGQGVSCLPADLELASEVTGTPPGSARTGQLLVANQRGQLSVIDLASGETVHIDAGEIHDAAVSPDGRWGVAATFGPMGSGHVFRGNTLYVVDMAKKALARTISTGEYRGLHDVTFRPGFPTRVLVTAQTSRRVLEVDIETGTVLGAMDTQGGRSHTMTVTPDGRTAFTTNEEQGTITRLDVTRHAFVALFPASEEVEGIAVTADGGEIWAGERTRRAVTVRDAMTGELRATLSGFGSPVRVVISPDGRRAVISDGQCKALVFADVATRKVLRVIRTPVFPIANAFSPDSRVVFSALADRREVVAADLETGALLGRFKAGGHPDGTDWGQRP